MVIWKARNELCRVVGLEKTRNRKNTHKKSDEKKVVASFQPSLEFQANLKQGSHLLTLGETVLGLKCDRVRFRPSP